MRHHVPQSGGPSWVLLPLIFETSATLPWEFRVVALSAQQSRVFFSSHLPTLQLCRIAPSQLLVPRFGMGYLWCSDCSHYHHHDHHHHHEYHHHHHDHHHHHEYHHHHQDSFYAHLKTFLFGRTGIGSAPE